MKKIIILLCLAVIVTGCGVKKNIASPPVKNSSGISFATVAAHNTPDDCWIAANNNIYNLSDFISQQPAEGERIYKYCGQDATAVFASWPMGTGKPQSDEARAVLESYYIGSLAK